jgi:hypothetical protein
MSLLNRGTSPQGATPSASASFANRRFAILAVALPHQFAVALLLSYHPLPEKDNQKLRPKGRSMLLLS